MDKDANVDYTMKDQVIFNSPRSHCEERNDEAIQYNMSFRAEREILTLNEVLAMTKRGVIAMAGENLWKVTGNYQMKLPAASRRVSAWKR